MYKKTNNRYFFLIFLLSLEDFLSIKSPVFFLIFLLSLKSFSPINIHGFFFGFSLGLEGVFSTKIMISNTIHLLVLALKREGNYNIMMSYNKSCNKFNQIRTILNHNLS